MGSIFGALGCVGVSGALLLLGSPAEKLQSMVGNGFNPDCTTFNYLIEGLERELVDWMMLLRFSIT